MAHTFSYTEVDLTDSYTPPVPTAVGDSAGGISYLYDKDKKLLSTVFSDSTSIQMVYDTTFTGSARPMEIIYDQGSTSFAYDSNTGQLTSVTSSDSVVTAYEYDGSLTTNMTWQGPIIGTIDFGFNNDFQLTSQIINEADTLKFSYNNDELMTQAGQLSMFYNPQNGLLNGSELGSIKSSYNYDSLGQTESSSFNNNSSEFYNRSFERDSLGRINSLTETIEGETNMYEYEYNAIGYLTKVKENGTVTAEYQYDANGNRTAYIMPTDTVTASYDSQDRMLTYGNASYSYGPRGNLQQKIFGADTTTYNYDNQGNLRSLLLPDGTLIEYLIDGQGRRVVKKVNGHITKKWLYSGGLLPVAELDILDEIKVFYGPGYIVKNDTTYRVLTDHLGSVRMIINSQTGEVVQRIDYDAWGNITHLQNPDEFINIGFAGGLYDKDTRLVRFGARDYDPKTGRWTSKDPILFEGGTSNLYEYVFNDPVNNVDPDGLQPLIVRMHNAIGRDNLNAVRDFAAGLASGLSFGLSDYALDAFGDSGSRNECSTAYSVGGYTGLATDLALGGKGLISLARRGAASAAQKGAHSVYKGIDKSGALRYVGRTSRNPSVRFGEHGNAIGTGRELLRYDVVPGASGLTKTQARVWEQQLINQYGLQKNGGSLLNKINSIAPKYWQQHGIR